MTGQIHLLTRTHLLHHNVGNGLRQTSCGDLTGIQDGRLRPLGIVGLFQSLLQIATQVVGEVDVRQLLAVLVVGGDLKGSIVGQSIHQITETSAAEAALSCDDLIDLVLALDLSQNILYAFHDCVLLKMIF